MLIQTLWDNVQLLIDSVCEKRMCCHVVWDNDHKSDSC